LRSLRPAEIFRAVPTSLRYFADSANSLSLLGSPFILSTAVALLLTIETR
jgi:membrane protein